jgi:hypothetical protein
MILHRESREPRELDWPHGCARRAGSVKPGAWSVGMGNGRGGNVWPRKRKRRKTSKAFHRRTPRIRRAQSAAEHGYGPREGGVAVRCRAQISSFSPLTNESAFPPRPLRPGVFALNSKLVAVSPFNAKARRRKVAKSHHSDTPSLQHPSFDITPAGLGAVNGLGASAGQKYVVVRDGSRFTTCGSPLAGER